MDILAVPLLLPPIAPGVWSQEMSTGLSSWNMENFLSQVTCSSPARVTVQLYSWSGTEKKVEGESGQTLKWRRKSYVFDQV